jgi:hypothetical protein
MASSIQSQNVELISRSGGDAGGQFQSQARVTSSEWLQLCEVINDFRWRHGRWPTRFRMSARQLESVRALFTPQDFAKLAAKIEFITDAAAYKAEDERGASCGYRQELLRADGWLGVFPRPAQERGLKPWWRLW